MHNAFSATLAASLSFLSITVGSATAATLVRSALPAAGVPAGWSATATRQIVPLRASDLGPVPANMPMRVVVGLQMRDPAGARDIVRRQHTHGDPMFGSYLTPQEFTARFNPTGAQVAAVGRYLAQHGFAHLVAAPNNLLISADARASAVEAAFATQIHWFRQSLNGTRVVYANVTPASVPLALRGTVLGVLGLHNFTMRTAIRKSPRAIQARIAATFAAHLRGGSLGAGVEHPATTASPTPAPSPSPTPLSYPTAQACLVTQIDGVCSREYGPYDFQANYDGLSPNDKLKAGQFTGSNSTSGFRTKIAIFAEGDVTQVVTDLATYQQTFNVFAYGLERPFGVSIVPVGTPSGDTSGQDEFDLDTQVSTGIAAGVKHLYIYDTTSLSDSDTALEFNRFATDVVAQAGSASFGEPEALAYADGAMTIDDEIFNEAASQGQTVFSSAGDNGAACPILVATGVPYVPGVVGVCYPASSPYVVGVGGTSLMSNANTSVYGGEIGWQGTGGGQSEFETPTYWQDTVVPAELSVDGEDRTVPDISMDADNELSPAIVIVSGAAEGVGGTSLSTPLSLGVWSRLLSSHPSAYGSKKGFGYAAPALYYEFTQFPYPTPPPLPTGPPGYETGVIGGFHDIEIGNNGLWPALPAYDNMTGMGSLDINVQALDIDLAGAP